MKETTFQNAEKESSIKVIDIPLKNIRRNENQIRQDIDETHIKSLRIDMMNHGIREPLKVKLIGNGIYQLVDGEHRYHACHNDANEPIEKFNTVPCIVLSDEDAEDWGLVANILRKDLTPCEMSNALSLYQKKTKLDNKSMAEHFGQSEGWVYDYLLLQQLPPAIMKRELEDGKNCLSLHEIRKFATKKYRERPQRDYELYDSKKKMVARERRKYEGIDREAEENTTETIPEKVDVKKGKKDVQSFQKIITAIDNVKNILEERMKEQKRDPNLTLLPAISDSKDHTKLLSALKSSIQELTLQFEMVLKEIDYKENVLQKTMNKE